MNLNDKMEHKITKAPTVQFRRLELFSSQGCTPDFAAR